MLSKYTKSTNSNEYSYFLKKKKKTKSILSHFHKMLSKLKPKKLPQFLIYIHSSKT